MMILGIFVTVYHVMEKLKDFFDMTKRERRGTIVLLLLMGVLLLITYGMGMKKDSTAVKVNVDSLEMFERQADSTVIAAKQPTHHKTRKKKHVRKRHADKNPKPSGEPRRLDPVPQF